MLAGDRGELPGMTEGELPQQDSQSCHRIRLFMFMFMFMFSDTT